MCASYTGRAPAFFSASDASLSQGVAEGKINAQSVCALNTVYIRSTMELHRAETTSSASQLEAQLQKALAEHFPGNHDMFDQSACRVAGRDSRQCPR
jgi:enterochelin esterase-like enzyme